MTPRIRLTAPSSPDPQCRRCWTERQRRGACGLAVAIALAAGTVRAESATPVTDAMATEGLDGWNRHYVPSLTVSTDAKVGKVSLVGTYGFTHHILLNAPKGRPWNLTAFATLRFWAKAAKPNGNFLVMLCTNGMANRRDTVVTLGTEWTRFELPFDEKTFAKNVQGDFSFRRVRTLVFYNNSAGESQIWLDGMEFAGQRPPETPEFRLPGAAAADGVNTLCLAAADPFPHLAEAQASRHDVDPRYDLPPLAFNTDNSFAEALVDFATAANWRAAVTDASGYLCQSTDQSLRGGTNLKLELVPTGPKPQFALLPPAPVKIDKPFDTIECWVYAGKHGGSVAFQFRRADGSLLAAGNDWSDTVDDVNPQPVGQFWNLVRVILPDRVEPGAELLSIQVRPQLSARHKDPTFLFHFDQLRVLDFRESLKRPPPAFPHAGAPVTGIPVGPEGACPQTVEPVRTTITQDGDTYRLGYSTDSGEAVSYVYQPRTGTLSDLTVSPDGKPAFQPAAESGPVFEFAGKTADATAPAGPRTELLQHGREGDTVVAQWRYGDGADAATIRYTFALRGKTLRIDAASEARTVSSWRFGRAKNVTGARVIEVPFMLYCPNVLLAYGLFTTYYSDWYVGNVSDLPCGGDTEVRDDTVWYNWRRDQNYAYRPLTDGRRNPFRERFYITASSTFDDVLLTVSNPPSPMKSVLKERLYRMALASTPGIFRRAKALTDLYAEYGMTSAYFLFHAPLFFRRNMGSEAFPGDRHVSMLHEPEGGDQGLHDLFAGMAANGIFPGYYDGFPSRDVTGDRFHYDWTAYQSDGRWSTMWRSPALKPWAFPEIAATLCRERAARFGARVAYQDGITSWIISAMTDLDHRFPDAGTLRGTLKALATGWQRCRENVNGPVFSEGRGSDFFHAGLNDGDYTKLKGYWDDKDCSGDRVQLLVDFRLRKLGLLSAPVSVDICYAGFAGTNKIHFESWYAQAESYRYLHHFLATEIAFAAIGMLEPYWPLWDEPRTQFDKSITSYFMIQQLQTRYLMEPVADIRYWDGKDFLTSSDALRADVVKDNQLRIGYRNGLQVWLNLNWDDRPWTVTDQDRTYELPPGGWYARQGEAFVEFSALVNGNRVDYVDSPAYTYLDGGGHSAEVRGLKAQRQTIVWKQGPKAGQTLRFPATP